MTALAATVHDPAGRFFPLLERHGEALAGYAAVGAVVTSATNGRVRARLERCGAVVVPGGERIGQNRRAALATALAAADGDDVLCIDFDRWLFWADTFPDELVTLPGRLRRRVPAPWLVSVGRTRRAWRTHPRVQRECEAATNRVLSLAAGRSIDATAGCCWLAPEGARRVLAESIEPTNATDLEWPALMLRDRPERFGFVRVDGLAFETAALHPDEI
ncbi:MAG: hypothetical protein IT337_04730, partial [Thermomicrobiales bacterium]|nr:hypothetical protein [Thermomicrobiales bacterium]